MKSIYDKAPDMQEDELELEFEAKLEAAGIIQSIWSDVPAADRPGLYAPSTDQCHDQAQMQIMKNITGIPGVAGFTFHAYPGGGPYPGGPNFNLTELILDTGCRRRASCCWRR